jgi:hypothetical protein
MARRCSRLARRRTLLTPAPGQQVKLERANSRLKSANDQLTHRLRESVDQSASGAATPRGGGDAPPRAALPHPAARRQAQLARISDADAVRARGRGCRGCPPPPAARPPSMARGAPARWHQRSIRGPTVAALARGLRPLAARRRWRRCRR